MAHLLQLLGKTTSRVHGSNFKITSHSWIGSCWTVGTGSREWLCWCQVGFDHCRCHPNLVDMSPQRNEESRLQWLFRSTLATLCDALWWVTQWCGPIFLQLHMPGRIYALSIFVTIVARMPGITLHFKMWDGSGSTRSPAALATERLKVISGLFGGKVWDWSHITQSILG